MAEADSVRVEYEWKPARCPHCCEWGHACTESDLSSDEGSDDRGSGAQGAATVVAETVVSETAPVLDVDRQPATTVGSGSGTAVSVTPTVVVDAHRQGATTVGPGTSFVARSAASVPAIIERAQTPTSAPVTSVQRHTRVPPASSGYHIASVRSYERGSRGPSDEIERDQDSIMGTPPYMLNREQSPLSTGIRFTPLCTDEASLPRVDTHPPPSSAPRSPTGDKGKKKKRGKG